MKIELTKESISKVIRETESGLYTSSNENNEDLVVRIERGVGMEIDYLQKNGWTRTHEYDADGNFASESFGK